jgi:LAO/AO transport system kinase
VVVVNLGCDAAGNKAGLMEIGDVRGEQGRRDGAQQTVGLECSTCPTAAWRPPVSHHGHGRADGDGVEDLWDAIAAHRRHLEADGELAERRAERLRRELDRVVTERIRARIDGLLGHDHRRQIERRVTAGELDPWSAADQLLAPLDPQDSPAP